MILKLGYEDQLTAFVNVTWRNAFEKKERTRCGMLAKCGNAAVAASTKLQKCVSLSSTEAENFALRESFITVVWHMYVLTELDVGQILPRIFKANVGSIKGGTGGAATNFNKRKNIETEHNYILTMIKNTSSSW